MTQQANDISSSLISEDSIREKITSIFLDSLIVDNHFRIITISQNVLDFLEFSTEELQGKSINYLTGHLDVARDLSEALVQGHFDERPFTFFNKHNQAVRLGISGFYLGLISDFNGQIILRVRILDEVESVNNQPKKKNTELDKFVYRVAHDIRGPLATIKGLVNLLKMRENLFEIDRIVHLIDAHANKLDERLFQLVYVSKSDNDTESSQNIICFSELETRLRKIIEKNAFVDFLELHFSAPSEKISGLNEFLVYRLSENLLLYILSLPMNSNQNQIFFRVERFDESFLITVGAQGFEICDSIREALTHQEFVYTDLIKYPQMVSLYSAQKLAGQLSANMKTTVISNLNQRISISIPFKEAK